MRRDTDFVLEDSPWPALLLEGSGGICRANRVAVHVFGPEVEVPFAKFAAFWDEKNTTKLSQLGAQEGGGTCAATLLLADGQKADFIAHSAHIVRGGHTYLLLQFFKDSGGHFPKLAAPAQQESPVLPTPAPEVPPQTSPFVGEPLAAAAANPTLEAAGLAHKQKLECALQLARSVSLDFNNALTSILGHTSLLLSKAEIGHPWRSSLSEIEKSAGRAAEIASDLAAFSRQEKETRGQMVGNLNALLERAVEAFRAERAAIEWALQFERKLCTVTVDESKIQQAFVKVLENAAQSTKANGRVTIQTRNLELSEPTQDRTVKLNPGIYVCVEISDNGEGIAPEVMPHIFEPFFTTKGKNHRGLGLAWVYGIVTNHGGGVAVSSQPSVGTSVRLYLPANKKVVKTISMPGDDLSGNQTVLMVDDEDLLLTMGQMILSSFGYTVLTANSGQKALDIFSQAKNPINLMITDLVMPNMSGRELTEHVQRLSPETRILWSSGYTRAPGSEEHQTYLQKPFSSQDLLRKVKEVLSE